MATETDNISEDIRNLKRELMELRDEVRVRLHLGAMDARDAFAAIERDIDKLGNNATQTSQRAWVSLLARLKTLATAFSITTPPPHA
jgi:hypothetical protein